MKAGLSVTYPGYIDGDFYCGYEISFTNYSSKIIKYIYLTLSAFNAVDDLVVSKRFTLVGPVNVMKEASYIDKYAFSGNQAISYFRIKKNRNPLYKWNSKRIFWGNTENYNR